MLTRTQARKSGRVEIEQPVDGPFGAVPPVRPPLEAVGKLETSTAEPAGPAPVPATSGVNPTSGDGFGGGPDSFPPAGFPLRCPGGQTGPDRSIGEMPRPPSEQGTSSLPGLATDNIGYQAASGGHTPQDHPAAVNTNTVAADTVAQQHNTNLNSRQPPALPPGAPTAAAQGLTHAPRFHLLCDLLYCFQFLCILVFSFLCFSTVFVMVILYCAAFGKSNRPRIKLQLFTL